MNVITELVAKISAEVNASSFAGATRAVDNVSGRFDVLKNAIAGVAAAFAGFKSLQFLSEANEEATAFAVSLNRVNAQLGLSTDFLQSLEAAGDDFGVSFEEVVGLLSIFDRNLTQARTGAKETQKAFSDIGIDFSEGRDNTDIINDVADAIQRLGKTTQTTAALTHLFGKNSKLAFSLFKNGAEGIAEAAQLDRDLGKYLDESAKSLYLRAREAKKLVEDSRLGFEIDIDRKTIPFFSKFRERIAEVWSLLHQGRGFGRILGPIFESIAKKVANAGIIIANVFEYIDYKLSLLSPEAIELIKKALVFGAGIAAITSLAAALTSLFAVFSAAKTFILPFLALFGKITLGISAAVAAFYLFKYAIELLNKINFDDLSSRLKVISVSFAALATIAGVFSAKLSIVSASILAILAGLSALYYLFTGKNPFTQLYGVIEKITGALADITGFRMPSLSMPQQLPELQQTPFERWNLENIGGGGTQSTQTTIAPTTNINVTATGADRQLAGTISTSIKNEIERQNALILESFRRRQPAGAQ